MVLSDEYVKFVASLFNGDMRGYYDLVTYLCGDSMYWDSHAKGFDAHPF